MINLALGLLRGINLKFILYLIGVAAASYFLWDWHYSKINELQKTSENYKREITILERKNHNLKEQIKIIDGNLQAVGAELNICQLEIDVYKNIDKTPDIKDTTNEGYLIY